MKQILAFIGSKNHLTINLVVDGEHLVKTIEYSHPEIDQIKEACSNYDAEALYELTDTVHKIKEYSKGSITIEGNQIIWGGEPISCKLVDRILDLRREGAKFEYLVEFLKRLLENPSKRAIDELFTFLEHKSLPITSDGYFLAYKAVTSGYRDKRTGKVDNSIGAQPRMPRARVCDDKELGCESGYHAGTLEYVRSFGNSNDKTIIVKIDPADVVSIPSDCDCQKLRCCTYEVISDYHGELVRPVYYSDGSEIDDEDVDDEIDEDEEDIDLDDMLCEEQEDLEASDEQDPTTETNEFSEIESFIEDNIGNRPVTVAMLAAYFSNYSENEITALVMGSGVYLIESDVVTYR